MTDQDSGHSDFSSLASAHIAFCQAASYESNTLSLVSTSTQSSR